MKKLSEKQKYIDWFIFAGVFFVLCFFLARYTVYTLDSDASSELVLAKHLADAGGGIMSKNWYYSTELEFLNDQLAFELMFFLTDNWRVVRMGGTLILITLLLISLYYFCRETDSKQQFPLIAALIMLPLSRTYFDIIYKFAYYIQFIATGFVVIGAGAQFARESSRKKYPSLILALLLSVSAGVLGFRMLLTLYIPLMLAVLMYIWLNKAPPITKKLLGGTGLLTGAALAGCLINQLYIAKHYTFHDYTNISFTGFSLNGVERLINSLLSILGWRPGEDVFSLAVLPNALCGLLFLLSLYCAVYMTRHREKFQMAQQIAAFYYLASLAAFGLLYSLTDMQYMSYHVIQAAIHGLLLIFMCFGKRELFGKAGRGLILGLMCFSLLCGALHYNDMRKEDKTRALREAAQFLADSDYTEGYASFWIGNLATELSNGEIDVWVWNDIGLAELSDPDEIVPWLQSKEHDNPPSAGKVFILLTANEDYYCEFTKNLNKDNVVFRTANYEIGANDEYIVYGFDSYAEMREQFVGQQADTE